MSSLSSLAFLSFTLFTVCHVKRREDDHVLRRASEREVEGVSLRGRPKKTWKRCVEEDIREMNIREETVYNRKDREGLLNRPTP